MKNPIRLIAMCLCLAAALGSTAGCAQRAPEAYAATTDLMAGKDFASAPMPDVPEQGAEAAADFALGLMQQAGSAESFVISPASILTALAMTANGAEGETLAQMEAVLGMSIEELNGFAGAYLAAVSGDGGQLSMANSIWFKGEGFEPVEDFLAANAAYYGAGLFKAPFDGQTVADINAWVESNTGGKITGMVEEIPPEAVMYLINAISFDAKWEVIYREDQVNEGAFTAQSGEAQEAQFMYSNEALYLEDDNAAGFIKPYEGGKYAFAALLPKEGVTVGDYIASLTGEGLLELLENPVAAEVSAAIPKFEMEYSDELSSALKAMGMTDAFDFAAADFSGLCESARGQVAISQVLHKAFIAVDEQGTEAGAATAVEMVGRGAGPMDVKTVHLDRPFLYMVVDMEYNLPLFMGTVAELD